LDFDGDFDCRGRRSIRRFGGNGSCNGCDNGSCNGYRRLCVDIASIWRLTGAFSNVVSMPLEAASASELGASVALTGRRMGGA
jgi:hypothetical protein